MKLKFYLITIALLFMAFGVKAEGENVITVHLNSSGTPAKIAIADVSKIVFEAERLNIITNSANYFDYSDVSKITFDEDKVGLESIAATNSDLTIFPNPAKDNLTINAADEMFGTDLYIYSITGTLVSEQANWNGESIDVSNLNSGIYFININSTTIKFVKQ